MNKILSLSLIALMLITACSGSKEEKSNYESSFSDGAVIVTKEQFEASGMELASLQKNDVSREVNANGKVSVMPGYLSEISPLIGGRVREVHVSRGDWVKRGETLFVLEGAELINIQKEYLNAAALLPVLQSDFERQKGLLEDEIASRKVFEQARAEFLSARAEYSALKAQLSLLGVDAARLEESGEIISALNVRSPIAGNVTLQEVRQGMFLNPGLKVMEVLNPEKVFVELDVYESAISDLSEGTKVLIGADDGRSPVYEAQIVRIARRVNPETRAILVHASLNEPAPSLLPDMYVRARILMQADEMWTLPEGAVVDVENRKWVLLKEAETDSVFSFMPREVEAVDLAKGMSGILNYEEFDANASFLTKGAFGLIQ
ncbi:efflux RND transporter periplasmic adaptor subunit [Marinilabilia salmonicolor]|uniref:efflux RND transporter periplasmic adaptor subunit n=1 Tax=Marinilabilia salmonicolor TaxID=989 RepID=UPI00029ADD36|nr:efflux RND transporter periplasmic adaptor subunit [Marinilabilia salmonicolor]